MIDLKLMIYESEANGSINEETRDQLIEVLETGDKHEFLRLAKKKEHEAFDKVMSGYDKNSELYDTKGKLRYAKYTGKLSDYDKKEFAKKRGIDPDSGKISDKILFKMLSRNIDKNMNKNKDEYNKTIDKELEKNDKELEKNKKELENNDEIKSKIHDAYFRKYDGFNKGDYSYYHMKNGKSVPYTDSEKKKNDKFLKKQVSHAWKEENEAKEKEAKEKKLKDLEDKGKIAKDKKEDKYAEYKVNKLKATKESVYEEMYEEIQNRFDNGEITFEEAELLNDLAYEKCINE